MKFILFTFSGEGLPVAYRLLKEGNDVIVAVIEDKKKTLTKIEKNSKEEDEEKRRRLSLYDGILTKKPAELVLKFLKNKVVDKSDYFVFFDFNHCFQYSEELKDLGYIGNFPTEEDRLFEIDRDMAKDFVKKNYPDVNIAEHYEFKTVEEANKFLDYTDKLWVLKPKGGDGRTVVPDADDVEFNKHQILDALLTEREYFERDGFVFEEYIPNPIELTPEKVYFNGAPVFTDLDIELKKFGAGDTGVMTGCSANLIFETNPEDKINEIAFPPIVDEIAKNHKGVFVWDISLLIDKRNGKIYMGEFCPNRFGYDSLFAEIALSGNATKFFSALLKGENPFNDKAGKYSLGVRMFNIHKGENDRRVMNNITIEYKKDYENNLWFYDIKKENNKIKTVGYAWDLGVATGVGESIKEASKNCYDAIRGVSFEGLYYRPEFDVLSTEYDTSILNRLEYGINKGLYDVV
jgi:phosphoribosylamine-glycine ligase